MHCERCFIKFSEYDINNKRTDVALNMKICKKNKCFILTCQKCFFKQKIIFKDITKTQIDRFLKDGLFVPDVRREKGKPAQKNNDNDKKKNDEKKND